MGGYRKRRSFEHVRNHVNNGSIEKDGWTASQNFPCIETRRKLRNGDGLDSSVIRTSLQGNWNYTKLVGAGRLTDCSLRCSRQPGCFKENAFICIPFASSLIYSRCVPELAIGEGNILLAAFGSSPRHERRWRWAPSLSVFEAGTGLPDMSWMWNKTRYFAHFLKKDYVS